MQVAQHLAECACGKPAVGVAVAVAAIESGPVEPFSQEPVCIECVTEFGRRWDGASVYLLPLEREA